MQKKTMEKLEQKCQVKDFVDKLDHHDSNYRNCYNCDGHTNLPCYTEPNKPKYQIDFQL